MPPKKHTSTSKEENKAASNKEVKDQPEDAVEDKEDVGSKRKPDEKTEEPPQKKEKTSAVGEDIVKDKSESVDESKKAHSLEKGHIYFFYRPKVDADEVGSIDDVQKAYMILKPYWSSDAKRSPTLIVLGKKKLPQVEQHARYWGFVGKTSSNIDDVVGALKESTYSTKTKGERTIQAARPMGEGVYTITSHNGHSHLAYILTLPEEPTKVQDAFNIEKQASIVLNVKNPKKSSPPGSGLSGNEKAEFPDKLQKAFSDRRFVAMETTDFLNYDYCELVMIGATEDLDKELGKTAKDLEKMEEKDEDHVDYVGVDKVVFKDLHLEADQNPVAPLKEWK
ncbi:uncharacterized protein BYT42DRAFT_544418 [Radiomyces spectabilis]|uniref:uncharacterized protein n=1 Tax=Radiomyces spectabilis TaxID=64574 RepID=UPI00221EEADE|nr:uncharacterized protein BYT42DRAFT_544418 [Radiomyces spectabilis]KAI8384527.1 hypothetical protein BYT42DRAFT_544418 [Radiomyces spectabilis]